LGKRNLIAELDLDKKLLDDKHEQTSKKIEYVTSYVEKWLYVMAERTQTTSISFIDAMCNAGIYSDGSLGTAGKVCELFAKFGKRFPRIQFRLYVNDTSEERVKACVDVCNCLVPNSCKNLTIVYANLDVNEFLEEAAETDKVPKGIGNAVLLFVDPYNARTVHLESMKKFIRSRYCEVLFNWFSSDRTRNRGDRAIANCLDGLEVSDDEDVGQAIANELRIGSMKYVFRYAFRISTNVELYQIIFITPHEKGLEKLKGALWDTFHGAAYHRNKPAAFSLQPSLFGPTEFEKSSAESYAYEVIDELGDSFSGKKSVTYREIEIFILEQTMLRDGQLIKLVLRPMVKSNRLIKDGKVDSRNYKEDTFSFPMVVGHNRD
jgi:three-Cys-motif partner protein